MKEGFLDSTSPLDNGPFTVTVFYLAELFNVVLYFYDILYKLRLHPNVAMLHFKRSKIRYVCTSSTHSQWIYPRLHTLPVDPSLVPHTPVDTSLAPHTPSGSINGSTHSQWIHPWLHTLPVGPSLAPHTPSGSIPGSTHSRFQCS